MFSILKRNHIDVFCYTNSVTAYERFPISKARQFIPRWWKDIPNNVYSSGSAYESSANTVVTMKRCPGIIELYKRGFMMPLWTDIEFIIHNSTYSFMAADRKTNAESHPSIQMGEFLSSGNWSHAKLVSPWLIETKTNLEFLCMQPHWNLNELNKDIMIPNGHVTFNRGNHSANAQMFVNTTVNTTINMSAGTPLMHFVPLTDKKIKVHAIYDPDRCNILYEKGSLYSFGSIFYRKRKDPLHNNL